MKPAHIQPQTAGELEEQLFVTYLTFLCQGQSIVF